MEQNFNKNQNSREEEFEQENQENLEQNLDAYYSNQSDPMNYKTARKSHRSAALFIVLGLVLLFFGGYTVYKNIVGPLAVNPPDWLLEQLGQDEDSNSIEELKQRDTDGDGLTDYQELYQFGTSIFLEDSDSDGLTDYEEVNMGEDPMCPTGQSCRLLQLITPETRLSDIIQNVSLDPNLTIEQAAVFEFRQFLLENGLPKEDVDALTDEDLLNIFEIWQESNIVPEESWSATTTSDEVRAFLLIQPGADINMINNLSDEELLRIRDQLMAEY